MKVSTTGTVLKVFPTQEFDSGFKKRTFILKVDEYNELPLDMTKDKVDFLNNINEGDQVDVSFFVGGRHWKDDKWFPSLTCGYVKKMDGDTAPATVAATTEVNDDLPF